ncbi:uncharacterized protein [Venturia canescens]|uniref:uncharacterized protein isoform X2 n=1 Tax=Venturia canescens TaxID=32260 RepID=UPI001C9C16AE|nr:uncharacterized protein LOC122409972 isoform X2 [Venturia canescens]
MEVVLSPGRFGDETPGVPFQKEEIREWSHVDRLTGMLERARVETGRWQTSNQGAAKSYGKVIDSRERNSADGSIVQRARRQVEIFQSQGRGRSVQVVRASQWSSSRVTDSTSVVGNSSLLPLFNKEEKEEEKEGKLVDTARIETAKKKKSLLHEDTISERLSALLGTFSYPVSSTVPLRRIDSKYSSRAAILTSPKRSNSNEDLAILSRVKINEKEKMPFGMENSSTSEDRTRIKYSAVKLDRDEFEKIRKATDSKREGEKRISMGFNNEELTSRPTKSAIQLPPSSKSNTTVVNLMGDSRRINNPEILDGKHSNVNWIPTSSTNSRETRESDSENGNASRNGKPEESRGFSASQKAPKRVGFSKTEIHFVADSGKVNIVETDEKPPPTNKFRRRRRLTGFVANKTVPDIHVIPYEPKINSPTTLRSITGPCDPEDNPKNELQRGHTTTVKLGSEISNNQERGLQEATSQGILLRLENRIYDRLEACTSKILDDSDFCKNVHHENAGKTEIQASALKSTRLIMNLTKNPKSSRIIPDAEIWDNHEKEDDFGDDAKRINPASSSSRCIDWQNENESKSIVLDTQEIKMPLDHQNVNSCEFTTIPLSTEIKNTHEKIESIRIDNGNNDKNEQLECDKKSTTAILAKKDFPSQDYDVVCRDAENNQVVLKMVTTHEPTIARVENDHFSKRIKKPTIKKKSTKTEVPAKKKLQKEHTYVNIFTGSRNVPIYENFRIAEPRKSDKVTNPIKKADKLSSEKNSRIPDPKGQLPLANNAPVLRELETPNLEKTKSSVDEKLEIAETPAVLKIVDKKISDKIKESKLTLGNKKLAQSSLNSGASSKSRISKVSKNLTEKGNPKSPIAASSNERDLRLVNETSSHDIKTHPSNLSSRDVSSTRVMRNNEIRKKPMEVVYQTAVYNMKNEKLSKPQKGKESKGPRYLNELICGAKTKRDSKTKTSNTIQHSAHNKGASQTVRHWK